MKPRAWVVALLFLAWPVAGLAAPAARPVRLSVTPVNAASEPIVDAVVTVKGNRMRFDENWGAYRATTRAVDGQTLRIEVRHPDYLPARFDIGIEAGRDEYGLSTAFLRRRGEPYVIVHSRPQAYLPAPGAYVVMPRHPRSGDYTEILGRAAQLCARYGLELVPAEGRCLSWETECDQRELLFQEKTPLPAAWRAQFLGEARVDPLFHYAGPVVSQRRGLAGPRFALTHRLEVILVPGLSHDAMHAFFEARGLHVESTGGSEQEGFYATVLLPVGIGTQAVAAAERLMREPEVRSVSNILDTLETPG